MPLFYFDVVDGHFSKDESGRSLPDRSFVETELKRKLSEIMLDSDSPVRAFVNVRDERHDIVATATISVVIERSETQH